MSSRLAGPLGPSNAYSFSTAILGIRRRSAASASRTRVSSFSFTNSSWRAASHSCGETIGGMFIGPLLLHLLVDELAPQNRPVDPVTVIAGREHAAVGQEARGGRPSAPGCGVSSCG